MARTEQGIGIIACWLCLTPISATSAGTATFQIGTYGVYSDATEDGLLLGMSSATPFSEVVLKIPGGYQTLVSIRGSHTPIAVSRDGSVAAGHGYDGGSAGYAWRWSSQDGISNLGNLGSDRNVSVAGMSGDGNIVVGSSFNSDGDRQAFRWTAGSGMSGIDYIPLSTSATASDVSADGKFLVGTANVSCPACEPVYIDVDCAGSDCGNYVPTYYQAFLWTQHGGVQSLGTLQSEDGSDPPHTRPLSSHANAISADGTTVVGYTHGGPSDGFIWRAETGMQAIPRLSDPQQQHTLFMPFDVDGDGSMIVGRMGGSSGINKFTGPGAVIWDAKSGTRTVRDMLIEEYGLEDDLGDWFLESAHWISEDGRTIMGTTGRGPEGLSRTWIVTLPVPEPPAIATVIIACCALLFSRRMTAVGCASRIASDAAG